MKKIVCLLLLFSMLGSMMVTPVSANENPAWEMYSFNDDIYTVGGAGPTQFRLTNYENVSIKIADDTDISRKKYINIEGVGNEKWTDILWDWTTPFVATDNEMLEYEFDIKAKDIVKSASKQLQFRFRAPNQYCISIEETTGNGGNITIKTTGGTRLGKVGNMPTTWKWGDDIPWTHFKVVFAPVTYTSGTNSYKGKKLVGFYVNNVNCLVENTGDDVADNPFIWHNNNADLVDIKGINFAPGNLANYSISLDNVSMVRYPITTVVPNRSEYITELRKNLAVHAEKTKELAAGGVDYTQADLDGYYDTISAAMPLYADISATQTQFDEKLAAIFAARQKIDYIPTAVDYAYDFDFDTEENRTAFDGVISDGNNNMSFANDSVTYGINGYMALASSAKHLYFPYALDRSASNFNNHFIEAEFDMQSGKGSGGGNGQISIALEGGNDWNTSVSITIYESKNEATEEISYYVGFGKKRVLLEAYTPGEWVRCKFITKINADGQLKTLGSTDMYINGQKIGTYDELYQGINSLTHFRFHSTYMNAKFDNFKVQVYDEANKPAEKGVLVKKIRDFIEKYGKDVTYYATANEKFEAAKKVYEKADANDTEVSDAISGLDEASAEMEEHMKELEELAKIGQMIEIPGKGVDLYDVVIPFALHYGEQEGDVRFDDIFFDGAAETDFSDVKFVDRDMNEIPSMIHSTGNYDFIRDSKLYLNGENTLHLSDGTLVKAHEQKILKSEDNGESWVDIAEGKTMPEGKTIAANVLSFVDRDDNIYYEVANPTIAAKAGGHVGLWRISKEGDYADPKCVIDCNDAITGAEAASIPESERPSYFYNGPAAKITWDSCHVVQDDDGYIYVGRYQDEWIGAKIYVSSPGGENFKCVDWRVDKQHTHSLWVNRNVYPNEVYMAYDDTKHSPRNQVTNNAAGLHAGYDAIVNDPEYDDKNFLDVKAHGDKYFTQVPIPYQNCDDFGFFGVIDKSPQKFYTATNGKKYTTADNVYGIGIGETNVLGGPSIYKTKEIMNEEAYYPVVETMQFSRAIISPVEGVLVTGLLSGQISNTEHIAVSYDDGETWTTAYSDGFGYSSSVCGGTGRLFTDYFVPKGAPEGDYQVIADGWPSTTNGSDFALRMKFGGDHHYALSYVKLDKLPATGTKIFVTTDKSRVNKVKYSYAESITEQGKNAIKAERTASGAGRAIRFNTLGSYAENAIGMAYTFEVNTQSKTGILVSSATEDKTEVFNLMFRTDSGKIYNADADTVIAESEAVATGKFKVDIMADTMRGICDVYVNNTIAAENVHINTVGKKPGELSVNIADLTAVTDKEYLKADTFDTQAVVYFENIGYADIYSDSDCEFIIASSKNTETGVDITVRKMNYSEEKATLAVAVYTKDGILADVNYATVNGSGTYPVAVDNKADDSTQRIFMYNNLGMLRPLQIKAIGEESVADTSYFELNFSGDGNITNYINDGMPYIEDTFIDDDLNPVFRMKFNEGKGNKVLESVSGKVYEIEGNYEWVENASVRYGNILPLQLKSTTALKLDMLAGIKIGKIDALQDIDFTDENSCVTIAYWTNLEVVGNDEGNNGNSVTDPFHRGTAYGNCYVGTKYKRDAIRTLLYSSNFSIAFDGRYERLIGTGGMNDKADPSDDYGYGTKEFTTAMRNANYYNLHFVELKGGSDGVTMSVYGLDAPKARASGLIPSDKAGSITFKDIEWSIGTIGGKTPYGDGSVYKNAAPLNIADLIIFDRELTYAERIQLYHGMNWYSAADFTN